MDDWHIQVRSGQPTQARDGKWMTYPLVFQIGPITHHVSKRYSHWLLDHQTIVDFLKSDRRLTEIILRALPKFPPKTSFFTDMSKPANSGRRQQQLHNYFASVVTHPEILNLPQFHRRLELNKPQNASAKSVLLQIAQELSMSSQPSQQHNQNSSHGSNGGERNQPQSSAESASADQQQPEAPEETRLRILRGVIDQAQAEFLEVSQRDQVVAIDAEVLEIRQRKYQQLLQQSEDRPICAELAHVLFPPPQQSEPHSQEPAGLSAFGDAELAGQISVVELDLIDSVSSLVVDGLNRGLVPDQPDTDGDLVVTFDTSSHS